MINKVKILRFLYKFKAVFYRLKGIKIGKNTFISGFPWFCKRNGGNIIIGNGVTLHSKKKYNTLITNPISISTITPEATVELHDNCGLSGCKIVCANKISIGEYTIIGPDTVIYDCKQHEYNERIGWFSCKKVTGSPITIGKKCYIGMRCIILKGVTIGDGCVISAGTIITKDVPAGHLAQGNPAVYTPLSEKNGGPKKIII